MDASGNTMQQKVPAHRSAVYISEVIDEICKFINIFFVFFACLFFKDFAWVVQFLFCNFYVNIT